VYSNVLSKPARPEVANEEKSSPTPPPSSPMVAIRIEDGGPGQTRRATAQPSAGPHQHAKVLQWSPRIILLLFHLLLHRRQPSRREAATAPSMTERYPVISTWRKDTEAAANTTAQFRITT